MATNTHTPIVIFSSISNIAQSLRDADSTLPLLEINDDALSGYGGTVNFAPSSLTVQTLSTLKDAVILISEPFVVAQLLEHDKSALPSLNWCMSTYAGVDPIFNAKLSLPLPWKLTRFAGCFGPPISEWCIARIISHERGFNASEKDKANKCWAESQSILNYRYLSSLTLTILGCGDIGCCIAKAAKAFGMKIIGYGKSCEPSDRVKEVADEYTTNLEVALSSADYIVSVLPSTPNTRKMLNGETFSAANGAVFLNVGRGDVVSEASLINALDNGYLCSAILDVFAVEPLPEDSKLWSRDDVVISPHVSGLTQASDVPKLFLENYKRWLAGKELKFVVDWMKGY